MTLIVPIVILQAKVTDCRDRAEEATEGVDTGVEAELVVTDLSDIYISF